MARLGAVGAAPFVLRVRILSMRNPLRRYYARRDLHFVTFSCYRCRPYLGTRRARDQFMKVLDQLLRGLQVEPAPVFRSLEIPADRLRGYARAHPSAHG